MRENLLKEITDVVFQDDDHVMRVTESAHWLEWQDWADPVLQRPAQLDPNVLYYREITIEGSYSPSPLELVHALHLIASHAVKVDRLITHRMPLEELPQAVELARTRRAVKAIINPYA